MKFYLFTSIQFLFWVLLSGCTSSRITIESIPTKSNVRAIQNNGSSRVIGQTPIEISASDLFGPNDTFIRIVIEQPGMYRESVMIPRSTLPADHKISVSLKELEKIEIEKVAKLICDNGANSAAGTDNNKLATGVATIQTLLAKRDFQTAEARTSALINSYPFVAVLHALLGNSKYLNKDYPGALKAYKKSMELEPENSEMKIMVQRLEKLVGNTDN